MFHVIEGGADLEIDGKLIGMAEADTCCAPGFTPIRLANRSGSAPGFLFMADESPLHRKLGIYETRS